MTIREWRLAKKQANDRLRALRRERADAQAEFAFPSLILWSFCFPAVIRPDRPVASGE